MGGFCRKCGCQTKDDIGAGTLCEPHREMSRYQQQLYNHIGCLLGVTEELNSVEDGEGYLALALKVVRGEAENLDGEFVLPTEEDRKFLVLLSGCLVSAMLAAQVS